MVKGYMPKLPEPAHATASPQEFHFDVQRFDSSTRNPSSSSTSSSTSQWQRRVKLPRSLLLSKRRQRLKWAPLHRSKKRVTLNLPESPHQVDVAETELQLSHRHAALFIAQRRVGRCVEILPIHSDMLRKKDQEAPASDREDPGLSESVCCVPSSPVLADLEIACRPSATPNLSPSVQRKISTQLALLQKLSKEEQLVRLQSNDLDLTNVAWRLRSVGEGGEGREAGKERCEMGKETGANASLSQVKGEVGRVRSVVLAEMEALKHVVLREECVNVVQGLVEELKQTLRGVLLRRVKEDCKYKEKGIKEKDRYRNTQKAEKKFVEEKLHRVVVVRGLLVRCMEDLKRLSVIAVEEIGRWRNVVLEEEKRRGKPKRHAFIYQGQNYLLKILNDANFAQLHRDPLAQNHQNDNPLKTLLASRYVMRAVHKWVGLRAWPQDLREVNRRSLDRQSEDCMNGSTSRFRQKNKAKRRKKRWNAGVWARVIRRGMGMMLSAMDILINRTLLQDDAESAAVCPSSHQLLSSTELITRMSIEREASTPKKRDSMLNPPCKPVLNHAIRRRRCNSSRGFNSDEALLLRRLEDAETSMQRDADMLDGMSVGNGVEDVESTLSPERVESALELLLAEKDQLKALALESQTNALQPETRKTVTSRAALVQRHVGADPVLRRAHPRLQPLRLAEQRTCSFLLDRRSSEAAITDDEVGGDQAVQSKEACSVATVGYDSSCMAASQSACDSSEGVEEDEFDLAIAGPANAARLIQTYVRGYLQRQKFRLLQLDAFIATHHPCDVEDSACETEDMAHEEEENEFEALAALLQKRSRQAVAFERRQVDEHGHAPDVAETSREKAALAIQAVARGSIARRKTTRHRVMISREMSRFRELSNHTLRDLYRAPV